MLGPTGSPGASGPVYELRPGSTSRPSSHRRKLVGMVRRLFLPLAGHGTAALPTVEAVRKRLGGRASTEPGAGQIVSLPGGRLGPIMTGVVVFVRGDEIDVWVEGDLVRRARWADTWAASGVISPGLQAVAAAAEAFAGLREGQRVGYDDRGTAGEGALVEKCRFGALVELGDGTVMGVGFRRLRDLAREGGAEGGAEEKNTRRPFS